MAPRKQNALEKSQDFIVYDENPEPIAHLTMEELEQLSDSEFLAHLTSKLDAKENLTAEELESLNTRIKNDEQRLARRQEVKRQQVLAIQRALRTGGNL